MSSNLPDGAAAGDSFADKLTIDTPEQTALDFAIAGIGSRFLALALDALIQMLVGIVVGIGGGMALAAIAVGSPRASLWGVAVLVLFYFLLYFGYFAFFEIIWNGQTPGKRKIGIRVIKDSGRPLTPSESIGRNLMRIVDWLPAFYAVGMVSAIFTKENKRLGDLVVGSLVVRESSLSDLKPAWQAATAPSGPVLPPMGADRLTPEECMLVDSYLNRRYNLEPYVQFRMADEILLRLRPKLTLPADSAISSLSADKILEALAYERRSTGRYT
ncbi:MAG TPA: RDD family protein [Candidatus Acidoferrum sp.]|nr:RDD family protein [Candidatus Acidoferrum sp.]